MHNSYSVLCVDMKRGLKLCCAALLVQVGVLSWLTPDTAATAPSIGKVKMLPVIPSVKQCLAELKAQHKDLEYVIGLSHTGGQCGQFILQPFLCNTVPVLSVDGSDCAARWCVFCLKLLLLKGVRTRPTVLLQRCPGRLVAAGAVAIAHCAG